MFKMSVSKWIVQKVGHLDYNINDSLLAEEDKESYNHYIEKLNYHNDFLCSPSLN